MFTVQIYLMQRGCDIWRWLCLRCKRELEADGWVARQAKDPPPENPNLDCDGEACLAARAQVRRAA